MTISVRSYCHKLVVLFDFDPRLLSQTSGVIRFRLLSSHANNTHNAPIWSDGICVNKPRLLSQRGPKPPATFKIERQDSEHWDKHPKHSSTERLVILSAFTVLLLVLQVLMLILSVLQHQLEHRGEAKSTTKRSSAMTANNSRTAAKGREESRQQ